MTKSIYLFLLAFHSLNLLAKDTVTFAVYDIQAQKMVSTQNENDPMILASVSKLLTMYYGLSVLGANHRFKTQIVTDGLIEKGVVQGNLYLVGGGEPYLTAPHLISLIHQLQVQGIKSIKGKFILDDSRVASTNRLSLVGQEDQPDNPAMGALNVEFNRYKIIGLGKSVYPPVPGWEVKKVNKANHGLKFESSKIKNWGESWTAYGKEDLKYTEEVPSRDNVKWVGGMFHYLAKKFGLILPKPAKGKAPEQVRMLAFHHGLPLTRLAALGIEYSNNLIAESILKAASSQLKQKPLNSFESSQEMVKWLKENLNLSKQDWESVSMTNGSGLSVQNKMSAQAMALYLSQVAYKSFNGRSFLSLLSINGHSGGIGKRLKDLKYAYRVYAKTGSLFYVNNLAGYFVGKSNKLYSFAIFTADHKKRKSLNGKNSAQNHQLRNAFKAWYSSTTGLIDQTVSSWLNKY